MKMTPTAAAPLLSAALLLLLLLPPAAHTFTQKPFPIDLVVRNSLLGSAPETYSTQALQGGILLGLMTRLMDANSNFRFTYSENPDFGVYLESVNGLAGNDKDQTYWELLVKTADGKIKRPNVVPFAVEVKNVPLDAPPANYSTYVVERGILLGGLNRLQDSDDNFTFSYSDDPNYGPFLESVNGVAGDKEEHTYWELLVQKPDGELIRPDVGIGCYIPNEHERVILNFTKW